ncbi:unnamed protein product [Arabis nemorensis]|uniref:Uncharacterized protein n=1 Tax=Arabis nemorensis TaxID=586526 RepID=A0A565BPB4_9BRAS|nr:unnamed protein product [Arabis nemorensis]
MKQIYTTISYLWIFVVGVAGILLVVHLFRRVPYVLEEDSDVFFEADEFFEEDLDVFFETNDFLEEDLVADKPEALASVLEAKGTVSHVTKGLTTQQFVSKFSLSEKAQSMTGTGCVVIDGFYEKRPDSSKTQCSNRTNCK